MGNFQKLLLFVVVLFSSFELKANTHAFTVPTTRANAFFQDALDRVFKGPDALADVRILVGYDHQLTYAGKEMYVVSSSEIVAAIARLLVSRQGFRELEATENDAATYKIAATFSDKAHFRLLEKDIQRTLPSTPSQRATLRVAVFTSAYGTDDRLNRSRFAAESEAIAKSAEAFFEEGMRNAGAVFYAGHTAHTGELRPPTLASQPHGDQGYTISNSPTVENQKQRFTRAIEKSLAHPPAFFAFLGCDSYQEIGPTLSSVYNRKSEQWPVVALLSNAPINTPDYIGTIESFIVALQERSSLADFQKTLDESQYAFRKKKMQALVTPILYIPTAY